MYIKNYLLKEVVFLCPIRFITIRYKKMKKKFVTKKSLIIFVSIFKCYLFIGINQIKKM